MFEAVKFVEAPTAPSAAVLADAGLEPRRVSRSSLKRLFDIVISLTALVIMLPFLIPVAILIKLDSPGPVFFLQTRIGRRGKPFRMVKFRTMRHNAGGPSFTTTSDPRITRSGHFLRRTRLDELPQLINILRGEMSWVGPRPEAATLEKGYVRDIEYFALRSIVRPGITGWAQINHTYDASIEDVRTKVRYDLEYLQRQSLAEDLKIMVKTVRKVL